MAEHSEPYDMACSCSTCSGYAQELQRQEYLAWQQEQEYQQYMAEQQEMDAAAVLGGESRGDLASRCLCGRCDSACWGKPFVSCCGACADGTPFQQDVIVWPLASLAAGGES